METTPVSDRRLRCDRCGSGFEVTPDELVQFSRMDWPRCCLVPMTLEVADQSVRPNAATELERPARGPRKRFNN